MRVRRKVTPARLASLEELGGRYKEITEKMKVYYSNNKEAQIERNKKWQKANPEKFKESCRAAAKRRADKTRKFPKGTRVSLTTLTAEEKKAHKKAQKRAHYLKNRVAILQKYHNNK